MKTQQAKAGQKVLVGAKEYVVFRVNDNDTITCIPYDEAESRMTTFNLHDVIVYTDYVQEPCVRAHTWVEVEDALLEMKGMGHSDRIFEITDICGYLVEFSREDISVYGTIGYIKQYLTERGAKAYGVTYVAVPPETDKTDKAKKFREIVTEMADLYEKKNKDYGDSFGQTFKEYGAYASTMRLGDKLSRAKQLLKSGEAEVKTESVIDTLTDLACYAIMLRIELEGEK